MVWTYICRMPNTRLTMENEKENKGQTAYEMEGRDWKIPEGERAGLE